jgi:hypothetical protein
MGFVALGVAWLVRDCEYWSGLLLNLGVALLLVIPLLGLERLFEQKVEAAEERTKGAVGEVRDEVRAVSGQIEADRLRLDQIQQQLNERLAAAQDADRALAEEAREIPSFDALWALLRRALELNVISTDGVRVRVPYLWERMRFAILDANAEGDTRELRVTVETAGGEALPISTLWRPTNTLADVLIAIADQWKVEGRYPGDEVFDASFLVTRLVATVELAIEARSRRGDTQLDRVVELLSPNWVLTEGYLEHYPDYYSIGGNELATQAGVGQWRSHMREKPWVEDEGKAARAQREPDFWMVTEIARQFFANEAGKR